MVNLYQAALRLCPNMDCCGIVMTVTSGNKIVYVCPSEPIEIDTNDLPDIIRDTLREAAACHSAAAYRASAMMVRRLLEEVCELVVREES
jgi:hypothetical protein